MKKLITSALALTIALSTFAGCGGGKTEDGDQFLEVYCINKGYGTEWLEKSLDLFQKQDWVKEKYPNLKVADPIIDEDYSTAHQHLSAGQNYNTIDIFFSAALEGYAGESQKTLANITDSVYNSKVPGEGDITVGEKMIDGVYNNMVYGPESSEKNNFYYFPYVAGNYGILYNATLLKQMNIEVPLTTNQFVDACGEISNMNNNIYKEGYAIADNAKDGYWSYLYDIWWAQYSSMSTYKDFFYGMVGNTQSSDVFKETGRLESLKVFEQIFSPDKAEGDFKYDASKATYKYIYPFANEASTNYTLVQGGFLGGKGVFHANGDYFVTEMQKYREDIEAAGNKYDFAFMRTPVISSIIDVVPDKSIADDEELAALVKRIDAGETGLAWTVGDATYEVTQDDYDRVKAARSIVQMGGGSAVIPDYASAKDVAVDLLRFMATDICQEECYIKPNYGLTSAFEYSSSKVENMKSHFSDIHKSRMDILNSATVKVDVIPTVESFPYGIEQFYAYDMTTTTLEILFSSAKKTAIGIHNEEIDYWKDAQTKWQQMISGGRN